MTDTAHPGPKAAATARSLGPRSVRARIFLIVVICAAPSVLGSLVAISSLAKVHGSVVEMDERSVRPLAALGDLRDMEGDMRDNVWAYLAADTADDRAAVAEEVIAADDQADADIAAYFASHGSRTDRTGSLMADFATRLAAWRKVRDEQVFPPADQGDQDAAYAAVAELLDPADEAMAQPLDDLYTAEVADAAGQRTEADSSYSTARLAAGAIIGLGLLLALLAAWRLTTGMLRTVGAISRVLADPDPGARVGIDDGSEIGAVATALDLMLDDAEARERELQEEQQVREELMREARVRQRLAEDGVRRRAQAVVAETSAAVLEELAKVSHEAEAVRTAATTIDQRVEAADQVNREMVARAEHTDGVVEAVNGSLRRVGGIADLIGGVAAQTNLLALNATIEAARAGSAGKGFAVVAQEVKELAAETERSVTEITQTLAVLESDAAAMAATIQSISQGIGGLDAATGELRHVAARQQQTATQLDLSLGDAIARIEAMADATTELERRGGERVGANAEVEVTVEGRPYALGLLDISDCGMRMRARSAPPLEVGAEVQVKLHVAELTETIRATVARRIAGPDGPELAVAFVEISERARKQIRHYARVLLDEPTAKVAGLTV